MEKALVHDKKCVGKFVALRSVIDNTVIAYADDPVTVKRLASENDVKEPLIFFVAEPEDQVTTLY